MAFFKKYNGTTNVKLVRMERLIWTLIYGGLLAMVLGYFIDQQEAQDAALFYNLGGLAVVGGVVMVFIRSRLRGE
ncbi:hypothetical protein RAE19_00270 [Rhodoferax sp. TBRC 17660]|uniref:Uncharacterized protein n=1 Tax=Rhodoferax potami TaxID=3068338 RepID=A0ABU3KHF1_9BURK|nr:hypothetical protein [Rhodoferax sp. TBRC 17660]MDT7517194.1 hypothetical protein [Rhodoferax sp. TBRC 17660]